MPFSQWWQDFLKSKGVAFAWFVVRRLDDERVPQVAASMTFTTLLTLVPVLTVMVIIASAFPIFDQWSGEFVSFINHAIVPQGADMVFDYINVFRDKATKLTTIGSVMLVVTSLMLIRTIDNAFNRIQCVSPQRPWVVQFLMYWALLTSGPLSLGARLSAVIGQVQLVGDLEWLRVITAVSFITVLLWGLYRFVPDHFAPASHALVGAAVTVFCSETTRFLFARYMGSFDGYKSIYGALVAILFFLLWLNLLQTLILDGVVLTSSLSYRRGEAFCRNLDTRGRSDDVLKILLLLDSAQQNGKALPVQEFRRHINVGPDELGELSGKLARHGYIYSDHQGWVLEAGAGSVDLAELFKLFVYRPQTLNKDEVDQTVDHITQPCLETLNIALAEFGAYTKKQSS